MQPTQKAARLISVVLREEIKEMPTELEKQFHEAMVDIYRRAKDEVDYNATRYIQMVSDHGGIEAAKILINAGTPSDGYTELWKRGRLDITVEALVVQNPSWYSLFEPEEIERAKQRLQEYEYEIN
jgi:hypothetical protein